MNFQQYSDTYNQKGYKLIHLTDAKQIIQVGISNGLEDLNDWSKPEILQKRIDNQDFYSFAIQLNTTSNSIIGIITVGIEEEGRLWIEMLSINNKYRRIGLGRWLIAKIEIIARDLKLRAIFVDLDDDNDIALKFYKSAGFKNAGVIKEYYYDSSHAIIMRKNL